MKRRLLLHVAFVSVSYYLSNGLYMLRGLVLARLLGPAAFGAWSAMRMVQSLTMLAPLGSRQGMVQLAPLAEGAGDHEQAERLSRTASGLGLLTALLFAAIVAVGGLASPRWRNEWSVFALVLVLIQLFNFYHAHARSKQRFTLAGSGEVAIALFTTGLGLAAAWKTGLIGFIAVIGVAHAVTLAVMWRVGPAYPAPMLDRRTVRRLLAVGFPLMASGGLFTLMWNVDKLALWVLHGSAELGIYAVQASFTSVTLLAPAALGTVLHPHLMRHLGAARSPTAVRPYIVRGGELLAAWSAPICALGCVTLHLPIRWWLHEYTPAIQPGRLLMVAAYFSMIATVPMVVVAALNGQRFLCVIRLVGIAVAVVGCVVGLNSYGLVGLAAGMGAALVVDGLWTHTEALRRAQVRGRVAAGLTARVLWPFVLMVGTLWLAWTLVPETAATWRQDAAQTAARAALAIVPTTGWALWRSSRLKLLR